MWKGGLEGMAAVIEVARREGMASLAQRTYWAHLGVTEPRPVSQDALDWAVLPNGAPLPATWRAWLEFDASWLQKLGWFESLDPLVFAPRTLVEIMRDEYGDEWASFYDVPRFEHCFLLSGGSDSRRVLVLTDTPDSEGEHPVFFTDIDDMPALGALHPGLDAYLGWATGLFVEPEKDFATYTDTAKAPPFQERNAHHVKHLLRGEWDVEFPGDTLNPSGERPSPGLDPQTGKAIAAAPVKPAQEAAPKKAAKKKAPEKAAKKAAPEKAAKKAAPKKAAKKKAAKKVAKKAAPKKAAKKKAAKTAAPKKATPKKAAKKKAAPKKTAKKKAAKKKAAPKKAVRKKATPKKAKKKAAKKRAK